MATATLKRKRSRASEDIYVKMPQSDIRFFQQFAKKMGWMIENKQNLWDNYIKTCPINVDITDEEIMEEVRAVRYAK
jgi:hypothetical protein